MLVAQSCPTLCNPMGCSPPGSSSMGFPSQEYWRGLPFPSPGDLPDPGVEPGSPALQVDSLPSEPPGKPTAILKCQYICYPNLKKRKPRQEKIGNLSEVTPLTNGSASRWSQSLCSESPGYKLSGNTFPFIYGLPPVVWKWVHQDLTMISQCWKLSLSFWEFLHRWFY